MISPQDGVILSEAGKAIAEAIPGILVGVASTLAFAVRIGRGLGRFEQKQRDFQTAMEKKQASDKSTLELRLADMESSFKSVQMDLRNLTAEFAKFQANRIESLDTRYVQGTLCKAFREALSERLSALPGIIIADERFRSIIRNEVRDGIQDGVSKALLQKIGIDQKD